MKINKEISEKILTIGPDFRCLRGGIVSVISIYSKYFTIFNYISTYKGGPILYKVYVFFISLLKISYTLLRNRNIKIVHIHGASNGSFYRKFLFFIISKYVFRKKVIYHVHGGGFQTFFAGSKKMMMLFRNFINNTDVIVCLSEYWKLFFEENFNPIKIEILPNIIDYPMIKEKKREKEKISFLFLGIICDKKGIFDLLEVVKNNVDLFEHKIELIIGGTGEVVKLRNLIEEYQIENVVKFVGWIQNETKVQYLQNSDVYILPSYIEGLPISILEAMSYGMPIISTNVGGIPEIVLNRVNGFLINPGDKKSLEDAMCYFINNRKEIEIMGKKNDEIISKFYPEAVIKDMQNMYIKLIN